MLAVDFAQIHERKSLPLAAITLKMYVFFFFFLVKIPFLLPFLLIQLTCVKSLQLCPTLCDPMGCSPPGFSVYGDSPGKNTGVDCHAFLQGIFPTQGSNLGLPHFRRVFFYHLSHQGSPDTCICIVKPLCCIVETITTHQLCSNIK